MEKDNRITMKSERGLVKYVKIKKKRDNKLEKEFQQIILDESKEINKNFSLIQDIQNLRESIESLRAIAQELTFRKKRCENRIIDAKDKLATEEQRFSGAKTEKERKVSDARQEIFARAQAKSELEIEEIEKTIKENNEAITSINDLLDKKLIKLKESNERAEELYKKQKLLQDTAKTIADDDFKDIIGIMEELRISENYAEIKPVMQTEDEYVFVLAGPSEYKGDLKITIATNEVKKVN